MVPHDPTAADLRAAIAMISHADRPDGMADALAALDAATEDHDVDPRRVALALAPMVVALRRAAGLTVTEWAGYAMVAAEDWTTRR